MAQGAIRNLTVKPIQSADLAFNTPGVIDFHNRELACLGKRLRAVELRALYDELSRERPGDQGRLHYDSSEIDNYLMHKQGALGGQALFAVRSETLSSALDEAIATRQNAFLERFKHTREIASAYRAAYSLVDPDAKPGRIESLGRISTKQYEDLELAYKKHGRMQVVTQTETTGTTNGDASSNDTTTRANVSKSTSVSDTDTQGKTILLQNTVSYGTQDGTNTSDTDSKVLATASGAYLPGKDGQLVTPEAPPAEKPKFVPTTDPTAADGKNLQKSTTYVGFDHPPTPAPASDKQPYQVQYFQNQLSYPLEIRDDNWVPVSSPTIAKASSSVTVIHEHNNANANTTGTNDESSHSRSAGTTATDSTETSSSTSASTNTQRQRSNTELVDFKIPAADNELAYHRAQIELQDRRLETLLAAKRALHLEEIMGNELRILDLRLKQLQISYIHTFLLSTVTGMITAVYKDCGEFVNAGEPVLRVENDEEVFLAGRVQFRGALRVGDGYVLTLKSLFEDQEGSVALAGKVVAVRGHSADSDEYEVILHTMNPDSMLPINYNIDRYDVISFEVYKSMPKAAR